MERVDFYDPMGAAAEMVRARDTAQFRAGALAALEELPRIDAYILSAAHIAIARTQLDAFRRRIESGDWP
ncbi:MAG: hypothetical protein EPO32_14810 [Anaerolineae bacterium]|nr:MAG: hypothetical protein EPO32_14810 [Anaerolineae bacterium]